MDFQSGKIVLTIVSVRWWTGNPGDFRDGGKPSLIIRHKEGRNMMIRALREHPWHRDDPLPRRRRLTERQANLIATCILCFLFCLYGAAAATLALYLAGHLH
jgi:hypothetical protein